MGAPFRKPESARGGSAPRRTGFAEERRASQVAVCWARHWPLTEAAWARSGLRSIFFETNLFLINCRTDCLLHAHGAAPGQQRNYSFPAVQPETADDSHRRGIVPPLPHSAHPLTPTSTRFASSSGLQRQERRNRGGVH